jgi:hypothetical protein
MWDSRDIDDVARDDEATPRCMWPWGCDERPMTEWDEELCPFHFDACERKSLAEWRAEYEAERRAQRQSA